MGAALAAAKELAFTFCSLEAKCENLDEEQFASLDAYEEVGFVSHHRKAVAAHCQVQNLPTAPPAAPTHPLPFSPPASPLALLLGSINQPLFPRLCSMAKNTCWEPFHPTLSRGLSKPAKRTSLHSGHTHTRIHTHLKGHVYENTDIFLYRHVLVRPHRNVRVWLQSHVYKSDNDVEFLSTLL